MKITDFTFLSPLIIISIAILVIMLTVAFVRNLKVIYGFSLISLLTAFYSLCFVAQGIPYHIKPLFVFDGFSLLFMVIIIISAFIITILSYLYYKSHKGEREEFFIILMIATQGALILVIANNFVSLFLGLETMTLALYVLVTYIRSRAYSIEAGIKYLVIASLSTAMLLFGMGLIYAATGTFSFENIGSVFIDSGKYSVILVVGFCFFLAGIGFKLALVPFHLWVPDVYQGAPAPVSAYIATISKAAVFAVFFRFFYEIKGFQNPAIFSVISGIAIVSMFTGNFLALRQSNIKRLLGYSSIAQLGYLIVTVLIGNISGFNSSIFYITAYIFTSLGIFGVISLLSGINEDCDKISSYKGLFWKDPFISIVLSISLLSLAGIPLTAGFLAKFYLAVSAFSSGLYILVISLVINSIISLYYYLKIITVMFSETENENLPSVSISGKILLAFISLAVLAMGILPSTFFDIINCFIR